jgi:hypothetical protein
MTSPSEQEEQWFKEQERRKAADAAAHQSHEQQIAAREERKKAHWMKCPKCGGDLGEREYQGVKIDQCHDCYGVWLDAGELEQVSADNAGGLFGFLTRRK